MSNSPEQKYKVVKFFKVSCRKKILEKNLTREQAQRLAQSYPDSSRSLVGFEKM